MERPDGVETNPLRRVGNVERKGYEKVKRRAFTHEEMRRLVAVSGLYALGYLAAAQCDSMRIVAVEEMPGRARRGVIDLDSQGHQPVAHGVGILEATFPPGRVPKGERQLDEGPHDDGGV